MAINFSALSLAAPGTAHQLIEAITAAGRDPTSVIVELTESIDIPDSSQIMASLNRLRRDGIHSTTPKDSSSASRLRRHQPRH